MTMWLLFAAMLIIALLFVILPLLKQARIQGPEQNAHNVELLRKRLVELDSDLANGSLSEAQFSLAREDLERELIQEIEGHSDTVTVNASPTAGRISALISLIAIPLLALGMYYELGSWRMLDSTASAPATSQQTTNADGTPANSGMAPVDELITRLEQKLKDDPNNATGWLMLGRSYIYLNRPADAVRAYAQAETLTPTPDAQFYAEYAEAMALANGERLEGAPERLLEKALTLQPDHPNALWLAGMNAFQKTDYANAVKYWEHLQKLTDQNTDQGRMLADYLDQARAGNPPVEDILQSSAPADTQDNTPAAASGTSIKVHVTLDAALAAQASADDTVFIFARAAQGPPMPLAIVRLQVKDLPAEVTLDDSQAMMPAMKLSNYADIVVGARVSKRGDATPVSGDLQSLSDVLPTQSTPSVSLTIDQVIP